MAATFIHRPTGHQTFVFYEGIRALAIEPGLRRIGGTEVETLYRVLGSEYDLIVPVYSEADQEAIAAGRRERALRRREAKYRGGA